MVRPIFKQISIDRQDAKVKKKTRVKVVSVLEERYRKTLWLETQGMHLAAPLISLDEIALPPRLLAHPLRPEPGMDFREEDIAGATLPYLPSWPGLAAIYKAPTLTIPEAISGDSDIVITGHTGMGKSVALAYLASKIAINDPEIGLPDGTIPFLVHHADLDLPYRKDDPVDCVIEAISIRNLALDSRRFHDFVHKAFNDGRALLLLDGADETNHDGVKQIVELVNNLKRSHPRARIILTASPDNLDGLVSINIIPFAIAAWGFEQQVRFLHRWSELWKKLFPNENKDVKEDAIDPNLINNWLTAENKLLTPLEYTLKVWAAYAGDLRSPNPPDVLGTHLRRLKPVNVPMQAIELLATQVVLSGNPNFYPRKAREWLNTFDLSVLDQPEEKTKCKQIGSKNQGEKPKGEKIKTSLPGLISCLVESGLLSQHRNNRIRFSHPVFCGYLAGKGMRNNNIEAIIEQPPWVGKYIAMQYFTITGDATRLIEKLLSEVDRPLFRNLLLVSRWLHDAPKNSPWRETVILKLIQLLQQEGQPLGLRGQVIAAFIQQGDDFTIAKLFRHFLEGSSYELVQLAALGSGAIRDHKAVSYLSSLKKSPIINIRRAALLALVTIGSEAALDEVGEALLHGDENLRRIAGESLANKPGEGYAMLKEGAEFKDDYLVRRASAYGLGRIDEPWAVNLLNKLGTEDDQWIVRHTVYEILEEKKRPNPHIPKLLPSPIESPWIIAFAGKMGMGVTPDIPPTDLVLAALRSGSLEEKIASLSYLRFYPNETVYGALFQGMNSRDPELREAVFQTISEMAACGFEIPDPYKFGVGHS